MTLNLSRQSDLIDDGYLYNPISIVGAGGIGSFLTLALAKIGFQQIAVYDFDRVEEHNLPSQYYRLSDIGRYKVDCLKEIVKDFSGLDITIYSRPAVIRDMQEMKGVVFSAVDSMSARRLIFENIRPLNVQWYIDGRMGGNQLEIYTVKNTPQERGKYRNVLWSDDETSDVPCTQRAVMYNVLSIASLMTNQLRLVLSGKPYSRMITFDFENVLLLNEQVEVEK